MLQISTHSIIIIFISSPPSPPTALWGEVLPPSLNCCLLKCKCIISSGQWTIVCHHICYRLTKSEHFLSIVINSAALVIKAFVVKNNFSPGGKKPPWLILRKQTLTSKRAQGSQLQLRRTSGAVQHELNLSDPEVKEHLVNYFLACEQFCWLFVLGERFKNTGNPQHPPPPPLTFTLGLLRQEFTEVYKLKPKMKILR